MARKPKTKKQQVTELLEKGKSVSEVVRITKCSTSYVYMIKSSWSPPPATNGIAALSKPKEPVKETAGIPTLTEQIKPATVAAPPPKRKSLLQRIICFFTGE